MALVPAKDDLLPRLSKWSQDKYGVGLSARALALELGPDEIASELVEFLEAFEHVEPFAATPASTRSRAAGRGRSRA